MLGLRKQTSVMLLGPMIIDLHNNSRSFDPIGGHASQAFLDSLQDDPCLQQQSIRDILNALGVWHWESSDR